jgi:hypothetical protein
MAAAKCRSWLRRLGHDAALRSDTCQCSFDILHLEANMVKTSAAAQKCGDG